MSDQDFIGLIISCYKESSVVLASAYLRLILLRYIKCYFQGYGICRDPIGRMKTMAWSNNLPEPTKIQLFVFADPRLTSFHSRNKQLADQCCS